VGELADRLGALRVRAQLPDGSLAAELTGRGEVRLTVRDYARLTEPELSRRIAQLARLLWARRMGEYFRIRSEVTGQRVTRESPALGRRDQEFEAARDDLVVRGRSADGRVEVQTRGMREWTVRIQPGTLRALTETQFAVGVGEAAAGLIADQRERLRDIAVRTYG
jgi:hypothetical protein